jgi:hypothetical protein
MFNYYTFDTKNKAQIHKRTISDIEKEKKEMSKGNPL